MTLDAATKMNGNLKLNLEHLIERTRCNIFLTHTGDRVPHRTLWILAAAAVTRLGPHIPPSYPLSANLPQLCA